MEMISRDKALMNARPEYLNPNQEKLASYNQGWNNAIEMYCRQIAELPTVEERKEGKWIFMDSDDMRYDSYRCSNCWNEITVDPKRVCDIGFVIEDFNYCPNCGARMKGE